MNKNILNVSCLSAVALLTLSVGHAAPVTVNNASFEVDAAASGTDSTVVPTDWTAFNEAGSTDMGSGHPNGVQYTSNNPLAAPADGNQYSYINIFSAGTTGGIYQDVGALQANTDYTLTVAIGSRLDRINSPGIISLLDGFDNTGSLLATGGGLSGTQGTWEDFTASFTTGASVSGDLIVELSVAPAGTIQADFDNVRLDASPVPEPSTYALLGGGLFSLMTIRRRKSA